MAKYIPNPAAIPMLARTVEVLEACELAADKAVERAKELAPVETGRYRDSIESDSGVEATAMARILARDYKANWIEFGTTEEAAHAVLRRAAESVGLKVVGGGDE